MHFIMMTTGESLRSVYWVHFAISLAAQLFFLALQVSMVSAAMDLQATRNERLLSCIPFLTLLTNCCIWSMYASVAEEFALFIPNAIGIFVGFYCTMIYHQYSRIELPFPYLVITVAVIITAFVFLLSGYTEVTVVIAMIITASVYASPLSTMRTVMDEKSTAAMPFSISLVSWLGALSWTLYALVVAHDMNVLIPSAAGLILTTLQMLLFIYHPRGLEILLLFCCLYFTLHLI